MDKNYWIERIIRFAETLVKMYRYDIFEALERAEIHFRIVYAAE